MHQTTCRVERHTTTGADWALVAAVMDCSSIHSGVTPEMFSAFLAENEITDPREVVFMATHSIGGRDYIIREGAEPAFLEDPTFTGGWYAFREEDVDWLWCQSATSGSVLEARRTGTTWELRLELPIDEDGKPYWGSYANAYEVATLMAV